jgi:hypothetical protein
MRICSPASISPSAKKAKVKREGLEVAEDEEEN